MATCTETSAKSAKIHHGNMRDFISNLHESVLSCIFSRLPTKDVVRTCILSKEWLHKWTSISYNFDILLKDGQVADFVDRTLPSCKFLKSFRLIVDRCNCDSARVQTWITTALTHNLDSLVVTCIVAGIVYPCSLLNTDSLRTLDLRSHLTNRCTLNVAAKNIAANLTSMSLHELKIVNGNPCTDTVMLYFPVLKTCKVIRCRWLDMKSVEIYAPLLTTFMSTPRDFDVDSHVEYLYSLLLIAPRLATFESDPSYPEKISLNGSGSSVVSASFFCDGSADEPQLLKNIWVRFRNLLNQLTNLEELKVSDAVGKASQLETPLRCDKLRLLHLLYDWHSGWICHMLHAVPSVKILRLDMVVDDDSDLEIVPMSLPPYYVVSQLEEVEFCGWDFWEDQYEFAKFLMKNGERLKKIRVYVSPGNINIRQHICDDKLSEVRDTLLGFPKCSSCLIIE